jgi:hypothetical protein
MIDNHGDEFGAPRFGVSSEGMFIDTDPFRPGVVEFFETSSFELFVVGFIEESATDMIGATNGFEVDEGFTSPVKGMQEALGMSFSLLNAWDGLSEGFLARFAPEASFSNKEDGPATSDGIVFDAYGPVVVGHGAWGSAFGAVLELRDFLAFIAGAEVIFTSDVKQIEFGEEDEF